PPPPALVPSTTRCRPCTRPFPYTTLFRSLDTLNGNVRAARVESAATRLHAVGLRWDAARLAGQAAIRTTDRTAMVTLLERARTRSEEHTSELQSREKIVCRLLLRKTPRNH